MQIIDFTENERFRGLLDMVAGMGCAAEEAKLLDVFQHTLEVVDGRRAYVHVSTAGLAPGAYRLLRVVDEAGADRAPRGDLAIDEASGPVHAQGLLSELVQGDAPKLVHGLDVAEDPVLGAYPAAFGSLMAVPAFSRTGSTPWLADRSSADEAWAAGRAPAGGASRPGETGATDWIVVFDTAAAGCVEHDVERMLLIANMVANNMRRAHLMHELSSAQGYIEREMQQISDIQRSLLPQQMPPIHGMSLAASYETFDRAGGDYYSFLPLEPKRDPADPGMPWGIIIADASGHGPSAAVVVAMLHSLLHSTERRGMGAADFIEHINANLQTERIRHAFVTAFFGILEPGSGRLTYVRAGHEPPILMTPGDPVVMRRLDAANGYPLGVLSQVGSQEAVVTLEKGECLVLYTDGITDAFSPGGERFKVEGIEHALEHCDGRPECVVAFVRDALMRHQQSRRPHDDQTIVALRLDP